MLRTTIDVPICLSSWISTTFRILRPYKCTVFAEKPTSMRRMFCETVNILTYWTQSMFRNQHRCKYVVANNIYATNSSHINVRRYEFRFAKLLLYLLESTSEPQHSGLHEYFCKLLSYSTSAVCEHKQ